jgi:uncharacterized RDD family membrane protein YckC
VSQAPENHDSEYRGERLGLPLAGPGSVVGLGRRTAALTADWFIALFVVRLFTDAPFSVAQIAIFAGQIVLFTWLVGGSMGQRLLRTRVIDVASGGRLTLWRAFLRTLLILLVFPAVVYDRDQRGLHDRAANSVVVRG